MFAAAADGAAMMVVESALGADIATRFNKELFSLQIKRMNEYTQVYKLVGKIKLNKKKIKTHKQTQINFPFANS